MCVEIPTPTLPVLGLGLSTAPPTLGDLNVSADLCCKFQFTVPLPPVPLPPFTVNASTAAIVKAATAAIQAYIDELPLDCPLE